MTTKWAHLPNDVHINRIIASAKANPDEWATVTVAQWEDARLVALRVAWAAEQWATLKVIKHVAGQSVAREAGYSRILVLAAYDDCAYMLDATPDDIRMLAMLGDHCAMLLLTACKIFHSISSNNQLT